MQKNYCEDLFYDTQPFVSKKEIDLVKFVENLTKDIPHSNSTLYLHLYNTFCILKHLDMPDFVCLAGLFHSINGTDRFPSDLNIELKDYISEQSITLIKYFSRGDIYDLVVNNDEGLDKKTIFYLSNILYANEFEEAFRMHQIEQRGDKVLIWAKKLIEKYRI